MFHVEQKMNKIIKYLSWSMMFLLIGCTSPPELCNIGISKLWFITIIGGTISLIIICLICERGEKLNEFEYYYGLENQKAINSFFFFLFVCCFMVFVFLAFNVIGCY